MFHIYYNPNEDPFRDILHKNSEFCTKNDISFFKNPIKPKKTLRGGLF
jgi:hypothetical protein